LGLWERGRYSEAIFGSHAGKYQKTAEYPPFEKGGSGGISIFYIPALSTTTRYIFSITVSVSAITCRL
jgi:hypothetical protein